MLLPCLWCAENISHTLETYPPRRNRFEPYILLGVAHSLFRLRVIANSHTAIVNAAPPASARAVESRPELEPIGVNRLAEVGVGPGVGKILPTPNSARSRGLPPAKGRCFWPKGYHYPIYPSENIERQEEEKSGNMLVKLKLHLVIEFRLMRPASYWS